MVKEHSIIDAYPLTWPVGYKRTDAAKRINSLFKQTMETAQVFMHNEVYRIGGKALIVSTNLPVRADGLLYADWMRRRIDDPGVAIYFMLKEKDIVMCCDKYTRVWENIYALGKGIEALRGLERWGVSEFLDRAFTGFKALPEQTTFHSKTVWQILGLNEKPESSIIIHQAFKARSKIVHPDMPSGSAEAFHELQTAYQQALSHFNIVIT